MKEHESLLLLRTNWGLQRWWRQWWWQQCDIIVYDYDGRHSWRWRPWGLGVSVEKVGGCRVYIQWQNRPYSYMRVSDYSRATSAQLIIAMCNSTPSSTQSNTPSTSPSTASPSSLPVRSLHRQVRLPLAHHQQGWDLHPWLGQGSGKEANLKWRIDGCDDNDDDDTPQACICCNPWMGLAEDITK